jgi:hypothetical protein
MVIARKTQHSQMSIKIISCEFDMVDPAVFIQGIHKRMVRYQKSAGLNRTSLLCMPCIHTCTHIYVRSPF